MSKVKVIGTQSSFPCARIIWALKLKEVEYEFIEEDLFNKSPLLLKMNPVYKKVPVLIHNDKPVVDSLVILEYIDETWKHTPLLPEDPYERATARFWAKFVDEKCVLSAWEAMKSEGENKKKAIDTAQEMFEHLEKQIEGKKYFGGEQIGYLDLVIGWTSLWLNAMEEVGGMKLLVPEKFPSLREWTQNFIRVPAIQESLPPLENVVNYFQCVLSAWEAMKSEGENKKKAIDTAQEMFEHLEKQIEGKKYFGGEQIGYLDLVIGWTSLWLNAMEEVGGMKLLVPEKFPSLREWTQNFIRVPAIQESLPPLENVVNYFQVGLDYLRSLSANKS